MKLMKTFSLAIFFVSSSVFANEASITGEEAQGTFENLKGQYEYSASAIVSGLRIDTITRHDTKISCDKETVTYANNKSETSITCISLVK